MTTHPYQNSDLESPPAALPPATPVPAIHTDGGAVVQGNVTTGGDFVGRDKITVVVQRPEDAVQFQQQQQRIAALRDGTFARLSFEPETVLIPGGVFWMGSDTDAPNEAPRHQVDLPDFRMGKYPVTVREFAAFVKATKAVDWANTAREAGWFNLEPPPTKLDHPITGVNWYDVLTYCTWLSDKTGRQYRLPSEAEWEKAASWSTGEESYPRAGNSPRKRRYPWGSVWDAICCNAGGTMTTPVTSHPNGASAYGCEDLLGNVQEWTCSQWGSQPQQPAYAYPYDPSNNREALHADALPVQARLVHRGGSYNSQPADLRCTARGHATPNSRVAWRGFRVVILLYSEAQEV